jgi:hypothetical protein
MTLAAPTAAQELPKPTDVGKKALDVLIQRCVAAGGLSSSRGFFGFGPVRLTVADAAKLEAEVRANRAALTPVSRDAFVARVAESRDDQRAVIIALLRVVAEAPDPEGHPRRPPRCGPA